MRNCILILLTILGLAGAEDLVNEENKDYLAKDYLGEKTQIIDTKVLTKKGYRPYMLIAYETGTSGLIYFESVSWKDQKFKRIFKDSAVGTPFGVSSRAFASKTNSFGEPFVYEGCYPHTCPDSWGIFAYYPETDMGYYASIDFSKKYLAVVDRNKIDSEFESFYKIVAERAFEGLSCERAFNVLNLLQKKKKTVPEGKEYFLGCEEIQRAQKKMGVDENRIKEIRYLGKGDLGNEFLIDLEGKPKTIYLFRSEGQILPLSTESPLLQAIYYQVYKVDRKGSTALVFDIPQGASGRFSMTEVLEVKGKTIFSVIDAKTKKRICETIPISCAE